MTIVCSYCGSANKDTDKFCTNCGKPLTKSVESEQESKTDLSSLAAVKIVKPKFVLIQPIIMGLFVSLFFDPFLTLALGLLTKNAFKIPNNSPYYIWSVVNFFSIIGIIIFLYKKGYDETEYHIYPHYIAIVDKKDSTENKTVTLNPNSEVKLWKHWWQKLSGLGNITIITSEMLSFTQDVHSSKLILSNIQHPEEVYNLICDLIKKLETKEPTEQIKEIATLAPGFVPIRVLIKAFPGSLFFTIWGGGFFGGITSIFTGFRAEPFLAWAGVWFLFTMWLQYRFKKKKAENTEYNITPEYVEVIYDKTSGDVKSISINENTRIQLTQSKMQKLFKVGTINIETLAVRDFSNAFSPIKIKLEDIKEPEKIYKLLKTLITK